MALLPVTLASAAAAAILNIWLSIRVGAVRRALGVSIGDGGKEPLQRRMRAQLNYVENTLFVLVLIAALELAGKGEPWLAYVAALYFLARIMHAFGMDGGNYGWGRAVGTVLTMGVQIGLAIAAMLVILGVI
jgi:uncharacterized protein